MYTNKSGVGDKRSVNIIYSLRVSDSEILCRQEKVSVLILNSYCFVFTGDGLSLNSVFTKIMCTPEKPLLVFVVLKKSNNCSFL